MFLRLKPTLLPFSLLLFGDGVFDTATFDNTRCPGCETDEDDDDDDDLDGDVSLKPAVFAVMSRSLVEGPPSGASICSSDSEVTESLAEL